jgi:hypothetical protein
MAQASDQLTQLTPAPAGNVEAAPPA